MSDPDRIKRAWQARAANAAVPDLQTVRAGADRFYRTVRRRNAREYVACVIVVLIFAAYAVFLPSAATRIGAAMIVGGTFLVAWQIHRRASATSPPEHAGAEPILIHQRAQLARQRDALNSIFSWYLLPLIPGSLVLVLAPVLDHGGAGPLHAARSAWLGLVFLATGICVWQINRRAGRRLQREIDTIDALTGEEA